MRMRFVLVYMLCTHVYICLFTLHIHTTYIFGFDLIVTVKWTLNPSVETSFVYVPAVQSVSLTCPALFMSCTVLLVFTSAEASHCWLNGLFER